MKSLVVYFSAYGTTKAFAEEIAKQTGSDIAEIVPVIPYDCDKEHYNALADYAKKEHDQNMRPEIKNPIDISGYDTVFVGYPMWWAFIISEVTATVKGEIAAPVNKSTATNWSEPA